MPRRFASRINSCAEALTWLTVPGADSKASRYIVWMESMTTTSGASLLSRLAITSRTFVAAARSTGEAVTESLPARIRT